MNCLRYFARRIIVILSGQHGNSASFLFSDVAVDECRGIIPRMLTHLNRIGLVKIIEKANRRVYVIPKYLDSEGTVVNPLWGISTVKDVEDTILGVLVSSGVINDGDRDWLLNALGKRIKKPIWDFTDDA